MPTIPITEFVPPLGKRVEREIEVSAEVYETARECLDLDFSYSCEFIGSKTVFYISDDTFEVDLFVDFITSADELEKAIRKNPAHILKRKLADWIEAEQLYQAEH